MEGKTFLAHQAGIGWDQESLEKIFHPAVQNFSSFSTFEEQKDKVTLFFWLLWQLFLNFSQNYLMGFQPKLNIDR